jgi:predicted acylesterase/phospholipase RssA
MGKCGADNRYIIPSVTLIMIKHLVFGGGGPTLFKHFGACRALAERKVIQPATIETIHATSAGGILAVMFCLSKSTEWSVMEAYLVKRPWHDAFKLDIGTILGAYTRRGIWGREVIEVFFKPLLEVNDLLLTITLAEFRAWSGIDLYVYGFELNTFQLVEVSHKSFPDMPLLTAMHMTCAIPVLVAPIVEANKCYIDGGIKINYPMQQCIDAGHPQEEIMGFRNVYEIGEHEIAPDSTMVDYVFALLYRLVTFMSDKDPIVLDGHEVVFPKTMHLSINAIICVLSTEQARIDLVAEGRLLVTETTL